MEAFVLETLRNKGWQRGGEIFWTKADAEDAARKLIKNSHARQARVLKAQLDLTPVSEVKEATK